MKLHKRKNRMSIIETLKRNDINSVWHFTDISNLDSIVKYGILSLHELVENSIDAHFSADVLSHSLDRRYGLDEYVHLAFISDHPMYHNALKRGSIDHGIWIELDLKVLLDDSVMFSDEVANKSGVKPFDYTKVEEKIDFIKMFHRDFWTRLEARKAEIMVPNKIDINYIKAIYDGNTGVQYGK